MPPAKSSIADVVLGAEKLLGAVTANASLLPNMEDVRLPVEAALEELKGALIVQQNLMAERQKATQNVKAILARIRDLSRQLQDGVRSKLGPRTEKLVEFQIQPLRPRKRKPTLAEPPPGPVNPPAPAPGADPKPAA